MTMCYDGSFLAAQSRHHTGGGEVGASVYDGGVSAACLASVKPEQLHIECKKCGKNMNSKSMPRHMRSVHKEIEEKMKNIGSTHIKEENGITDTG